MKYAIILVVIFVYVLIGIFVNRLLTYNDDGLDMFLIVVWPLMLVCLAVIGICTIPIKLADYINERLDK